MLPRGPASCILNDPSWFSVMPFSLSIFFVHPIFLVFRPAHMTATSSLPIKRRTPLILHRSRVWWPRAESNRRPADSSPLSARTKPTSHAYNVLTSSE